MKKPIICSNLAMRFYKKYWTKEEVEECLVKGEIVDKFPDDEDPYFIPAVGAVLDIDMLLKKATNVVRTYNDRPSETDKEFLAHFNW